MAGRGRGVGLTRPAWMNDVDRPGEPAASQPSISVLGKRDSVPDADDAGLPDGWAQVSMPDGRAYWYHKTTNETTWVKPTREDVPKKPRLDARDSQAAWKEAKTEDGKTYYFCEATNETQWDRPAGMDPPGSNPVKEDGKTPDAVPEKKIQEKSEMEPLAPGWREYSAPDGSKYYSHTASGETRWERPVASNPPEVKPVQAVPGSAANWVSSKTPDGKTYYYNRITQQTSWTPPAQSRAPIAPAPSRQSALAAASKATNKKRGGGGGRKAAARVQRPRDENGKALKDKQVETYFIAEARKKSRKKGVMEEPPQKPPADFVQANSTFQEMLRERGISADSTWLQAMRSCASDPRYLSCWRTYGLRKDAFLRFVAQQRKLQRNDELQAIRLGREQFLACLEEATESEDAGIQSLAECSETVRKSVENDARYLALQDLGDRQSLAEYYFVARDRVMKERKRADRRAKMHKLRLAIDQMSSEDPPQITDDMPVRKISEMLQTKEEVKHLTDVEINIVLDEWVRDSARRKAQKRAKDRQEAIERERREKLAFKEGLCALVEQRAVHLRATWQESRDEILSKPWAQSSSLENKHEDLFFDIMSELSARLRDCKSKVKAVVKQKAIDMVKTMTFEEYRAIDGIREILENFKLSPDLEVVIFEDLKQRHAERAEREVQKKEDAKDDFWAFLKRKEYGVDGEWETTKGEISHRSAYRDLESLVGEEQVKQCFLDYVAKRKEKEQKKIAAEEQVEKPAAPLPPPPPGSEEDGGGRVAAELADIAERRKAILAKLGE